MNQSTNESTVSGKITILTWTGIVADVAGVVAIGYSAPTVLPTVLGIVAVLTGLTGLMARRDRPADWRKVISGISIIAGVVVLTVLIDRSVLESDPPSNAITFSSPSDGQELTDDGLDVLGDGIEKLKDGEKLWLSTLQIPRTANDAYQPKDRPCTVFDDGRFDCGKIYAGIHGNLPERRYEVILLRVTSAAAKNFEAYIGTNPEKQHWPGYKVLPRGATQIGSVKVVRRNAG